MSTVNYGRFLADFNQFHQGLEFTLEKSINNELVFLDTCIYLDNANLELKQYSKPSKSNVFMNFKHAVTSKSIKTGLVTGELNRARNCSTTDDNFGKTVKTLN